MKLPATFLALARDNLRFLPWYLWPVLVLIWLGSVWQARVIDSWTIWGSSVSTGLHFPFVTCVILGGAFFGRDVRWACGRVQPPRLESVSIANAYLFRIALFFLLILMAPALEIWGTAAHPDLKVNFYHSADQNPDLAAVRLYQKQFPNAALVHAPDPGLRPSGYDTTLVIPFGKILVGLWSGYVAFFIGLAFQVGSLILPASYLRGLQFIGLLAIAYFIASVLILTLFPQIGFTPTIYEDAFFYFLHHSLAVAACTAGYFMLIQWFSLRRMQKLEVN